MNGAEAILTTARDAGVDVCFANPGTTEMALVAALDSVGGIRPVARRLRGRLHGRGRAGVACTLHCAPGSIDCGGGCDCRQEHCSPDPAARDALPGR